MIYRTAILCLAFLVVSLIASAEVVNSPKGSKCNCPLSSGPISEKACALDWISHARVLSKTMKTINGTKVVTYQLDHLKVFRGAKTLPKLLMVPVGPCALNLQKNKDYLLSGLNAGKTQLISSQCLSLQKTTTPVWNKVPQTIKTAITKLTCKGLPTIKPTLPTVTPKLPIRP